MMKCKNCLIKFDKVVHIPYMLIGCFHTYCLTCLKGLKKCPNLNCMKPFKSKRLNEDLFELLSNDETHLKESLEEQINKLDQDYKLLVVNCTNKKESNQTKLIKTEEEIVLKTNEKIDLLLSQQNDLIHSLRKSNHSLDSKLQEIISRQKLTETNLNQLRYKLINTNSINVDEFTQDLKKIENVIDFKQLDDLNYNPTFKSNESINKNSIAINIGSINESEAESSSTKGQAKRSIQPDEEDQVIFGFIYK